MRCYITAIDFRVMHIDAFIGQVIVLPSGTLSPLVLYHHWSSLIWHEEESFPSNVGHSKKKMTTSATLGLGKNCFHNWHPNYP